MSTLPADKNTLIHELTHVWQGQNAYDDSEFYTAIGLITQMGTTRTSTMIETSPPTGIVTTLNSKRKSLKTGLMTASATTTLIVELVTSDFTISRPLFAGRR